jgi:hypothetical protein
MKRSGVAVALVTALAWLAAGFVHWIGGEGAETAKLQAVFLGFIGVGGACFLGGLVKSKPAQSQEGSLATEFEEIGAAFVGVGGLGVAIIQFWADSGWPFALALTVALTVLALALVVGMSKVRSCCRDKRAVKSPVPDEAASASEDR